MLRSGSRVLLALTPLLAAAAVYVNTLDAGFVSRACAAMSQMLEDGVDSMKTPRYCTTGHRGPGWHWNRA